MGSNKTKLLEGLIVTRIMIIKKPTEFLNLTTKIRYKTFHEPFLLLLW